MNELEQLNCDHEFEATSEWAKSEDDAHVGFEYRNTKCKKCDLQMPEGRPVE